MRSFAGKFVGIGPMQASWFKGTMKLDIKVVFRRFSQYFFLYVHHLLIVPIHKIDHHSLYSPLLELCEVFFQIGIDRFPVYPNIAVSYTHLTLPTIYSV